MVALVASLTSGIAVAAATAAAVVVSVTAAVVPHPCTHESADCGRALLLLLLLSSLLLLLLLLLVLPVPLVKVLDHGPPFHSLRCLYVPCLYLHSSVRECGVRTFTIRVVGSWWRLPDVNSRPRMTRAI